MKLSLVRLFPASLLATFVVVACSGANDQEVLKDPPPTNTRPGPNPSDAGNFDVNHPDTSVPDTSAPTPTCVPENNATFCSRNNAQCGQASGVDNCGNDRVAPLCGSCATGTTCKNNVCVVPNCVPETDAALCLRLNKDCGTLPTIANNCGELKTPVCGPVCGKGFQCTANKCTLCVAKTCADLGLVCGDQNDGCNPAPLKCTCDATHDCTANVCVPKPPLCVPKACPAGVCGAFDDGCTPGGINCGNCDATHACVNKLCVACTPNTNLALCTNAGYQCGTLDTVDNCGQPRHVVNCSNPDPGVKLCDYACLANHTCCAPRTVPAICAAMGRECNSISWSECEQPAVSINCGTCAALKACNAAGKCI